MQIRSATGAAAEDHRRKAAFGTADQLAFGVSGSIKEATRWANVSRWAHYQWLATDPTYPARFEAARAQATQTLVDEAVRRAHRGVRKEVRYKGKVVGHELVYSDQLLLALLKALDPERFRDKSKVDMSVNKVTDISQISAEVLLNLLPPEERIKLLEEHAALVLQADFKVEE